MKFYRRLLPFKAISFDLDDTLYSNGPIMADIEQKMIAYFAQLLPNEPKALDASFWFYFKKQAILIQGELAHDVALVRYQSYRLGLLSLGHDDNFAHQEAQAAFNYFVKLRSDFKVPKESVHLLKNLSEKLPLVSISNGNVDTEALGIAHFFQHIYHAGFQQVEANVGIKGSLLRHKPAQDMFSHVCDKLAILPQELLHVGDCGNADIHGAIEAGCQAVWLPKYGVGKALKQLPHIELSEVSELEQLL